MSTYFHHEYKGFIVYVESAAGRKVWAFYQESNPEVSGWAQTLEGAKEMIEEILNEEKS